MYPLTDMSLGTHSLDNTYDTSIEVEQIGEHTRYTLRAEGFMQLCHTPGGQHSGWCFAQKEYPWMAEKVLSEGCVMYPPEEFKQLLISNKLPEGNLELVLVNGNIVPIGIYDPNDKIQTGYPYYLNKQAFINLLEEEHCIVIWDTKHLKEERYGVFGVIVFENENGDYMLHQPGGVGKQELDEFKLECRQSIQEFVHNIESGYIIEYDGTFGGTYINGYKSNLGVYTINTENSFGYFPIQSYAYTKVLKKTDSYVLWYNK